MSDKYTYDSFNGYSNDLKQRHRKYVGRRNGAILTVCFGVLFSFLGYVLWQNSLIREKYEEALINQSRYLSQVALERLEDRDRVGALQIALAALPNEEKPDRPIVAEAEYALNSALYSYNHYSNKSYQADKQLALEYLTGEISCISPEGNYMLHIDQGGNAYVIDVAERGIAWVKDSGELEETWLNGCFPSETEVIFYNTKELVAFDTKEGKQLWRSQMPSYSINFDEPLSTCAGDKLVLGTAQWVAVYDLTDGKLLHDEEFANSTLYSDMDLADLEVNGSHTKVFLGIKEGLQAHDNELNCIVELDLETYEIGYWEVGDVEQLRFLDDSTVMILRLQYEEKNYVSYVTQVQLSCLNLDTGEVIWEHAISGNFVGLGSELGSGSLIVGNLPRQTVGICYLDNQVWLVDLSTGEILFTRSFEDNIVHMWDWNSSSLLVALADGTVQIFGFSAVDSDLVLVPAGIETTAVYYSISDNTLISVPESEASLLFSTPIYDESITVMGNPGSIGYIGWGDSADGEMFRAVIYDQYEDEVLSRIEVWKIGQQEPFVSVACSSLDTRIASWFALSEDLTILWYVEEDKAYDGEAQLHAYDIEQKEIRETFDLPSRGASIECATNYDKVLIYEYDVFDVLDVTTGETESFYDGLAGQIRIQDFRMTSIYDIQLAMDGRYALLHLYSMDSTNALAIWDLELSQLVSIQGADFVEFGESLDYNGLVLSEAGNKVAFYHSSRKEIQILNLETFTYENSIPFATKEKALFQFFCEDKYMILYGDTPYLKLWDLEQGRQVVQDETRVDYVTGIYTDGSPEYFGVIFNENLNANATLYRLTEDGRICRVADVPGGMICYSAEEIVCQCGPNQFGYYKFHTLEELIDMAKEVIGQDLMTEEEKRQYFIE